MTAPLLRPKHGPPESRAHAPPGFPAGRAQAGRSGGGRQTTSTGRRGRTVPQRRVKHQAASDDLSPHPRGREEAARERWHAGQPARNAFERDVYPCLRTTQPLA